MGAALQGGHSHLVDLLGALLGLARRAAHYEVFALTLELRAREALDRVALQAAVLLFAWPQAPPGRWITSSTRTLRGPTADGTRPSIRGAALVA